VSSPEPPADMSVHPYKPSQRVRAYIGSIILSGSEIDHLISLALFRASGLTEKNGFILFGRSTISTKMGKLRYLVQTSYKDGPNIEEFSDLEQDIQTFSKVRNMVAHGLILGMAAGEIIFNLYADYGDIEGVHISNAIGTTEDNIKISATMGKQLVGVIKFLFDVHSSHETGQYILLKGPLPSRKSLRKNNPSKSQPPP
jgi:hypothetical protein